MKKIIVSMLAMVLMSTLAVTTVSAAHTSNCGNTTGSKNISCGSFQSSFSMGSHNLHTNVYCSRTAHVLSHTYTCSACKGNLGTGAFPCYAIHSVCAKEIYPHI